MAGSRCNFEQLFLISLLLNAAVSFRSSSFWKKLYRQVAVDDTNGATDAPTNTNDIENDLALSRLWRNLLIKYLAVYLLAAMSDWLQGPYVYALYSSYGFLQSDIAVLFVAGFASSMIVGSVIGGMADLGGRRRFVVLFAVVYGLSCLTKHFKSYGILMIGRVLGGIATSLLFSVFEAWLIRAHSDAGLEKYIGRSLAWASYCNSIVAIFTGLLANEASDNSTMVPVIEEILYIGGYLNPFDIALVTLFLCGVGALILWDENYGHDREQFLTTTTTNSHEGSFFGGIRQAFIATIYNRKILLCGIISSLFEGSMYIFVFMWTPALNGDGEEPLPFGVIFSTFMVCCMAGSSLFSILAETHKVEHLGVAVFAVGGVSMACLASSNSQQTAFLSMCCFETMVGAYWPIMGTMKGSIVPESKRAAIYNLYRIPLNFIVLLILLSTFTPTQSFTLNCTMLFIACGLQVLLLVQQDETVAATDIEEDTLEIQDLVERADSSSLAEAQA